jgi:hypothetical protein
MTINNIADDVASIQHRLASFTNKKDKSILDYDEYLIALRWELHFVQTKAEFLAKDLEYLKESIIHKFSIVGIE